MLCIGSVMSAVQIGAIALWITKGLWIPFAAGMPIVIMLGVLLTRIYHKNTAYICPECNAEFKPTIKKLIFSNHTAKTRKLACTNCGYRGWCVEVRAG